MAVNLNPRKSAFRHSHKELLNFIETESWKGVIYPHQQEALVKIKGQLEDKKKPNIALVVLPTGCGKTGVAVLAPYVLGSQRVLVLTPSNAISEQIFHAFRSKDMFLVQRGIIPEDEATHARPSAQLINKSERIRDAKVDDLLIVTAHQIGGKSRVGIDEIPCDDYDLVIVDEAHHYPAKTWKTIVDHFSSTNRIFLTATPTHKDRYILRRVEKHLAGFQVDEGDRSTTIRIEACCTLNLQQAIGRRIIRRKQFVEVPIDDDDINHSVRIKEKENLGMVDDAETVKKREDDGNKEVAKKIVYYLKKHDEQDQKVEHQAIVLTQTIEGTNSATNFCECYNDIAFGDYNCEKYVGSSNESVLSDFGEGKIRTLVVVDKLKEGYDNNKVSVVAIVRNVQQKSRVLFTQFVGRAIRKAHDDDCVIATIIAHKRHNQKPNYDQFDSVADEDVIVEE